MSAACHRRDSCRLCEGRDLEAVLPLEPTPIADDYVGEDRLQEAQECYPLDVWLCRACGHAQLLDVVSPDRLFTNYTYRTAISLGLVDHFRALAADLLEHLPLRPGSLVLEIGSNDGAMLKPFHERGIRVVGVDPARRIAEDATASGIETVPAFFTSALAADLRARHGTAALIVANNVFAHADALGDIADGIRMLLGTDGVFVFEVSYVVDILDKMLFDTVYHEHLCYHSVRPLVRFFARHGLELIDVERIPTKGGSLRGTAQVKGGPRPVSPAVGEMMALEEMRQLDRPAPYRTLADRVNTAKSRLLTLLDELRAEGRTIAGFGASATVTTLLHHFELGDRLAFLVDDNPAKHGTYSPGHHLPVLPASALRERRPTHAVVLAWAYADPILRKHSEYLRDGGRFIVPLPELRVT